MTVIFDDKVIEMDKSDFNLRWKELGPCIACGKEKPEHELWSPAGHFYGPYCSGCYDEVNTGFQNWLYNNGPIPDFIKPRR